MDQLGAFFSTSLLDVHQQEFEIIIVLRSGLSGNLSSVGQQWKLLQLNQCSVINLMELIIDEIRNKYFTHL